MKEIELHGVKAGSRPFTIDDLHRFFDPATPSAAVLPGLSPASAGEHVGEPTGPAPHPSSDGSGAEGR